MMKLKLRLVEAELAIEVELVVAKQLEAVGCPFDQARC